MDTRDPRALLLEEIMLNECERSLIEKLTLVQILQSATMQPASPAADTELKLMKEAHKSTRNKIIKLGQVLLPWEDMEVAKPVDMEKEGATLLKQWEAVFGKLSDPETQRKLDTYRLPSQPDDARTLGV